MKSHNPTEKFLNIELAEQRNILQTVSPIIGKSAQILEKDIWICWALDKLFAMPDAHPMAFKGGTSLSKVFNIIERFSEDVDITIDYRSFQTSDPFVPGTSNTQRKKISEKLKAAMKDYIDSKVAPYLKILIAEELTKDIEIKISADGEKLEIHYPSACDSLLSYIKPFVFIEFGARNVTEPSAIHAIQPEIISHVAALEFPNAKVNVLNPERTFWEKMTLIHVECNRGNFKASADRLSRHWYDVVMLYKSTFGESALKKRELLNTVVEHKKVFLMKVKQIMMLV